MQYAVKDIRPNPFRHIDRYAIRRDKVDALRESLRTTGFWDNVVARIGADGKPEIAYGHHRLAALRAEYSSGHKVNLIVRELSDEDMLKIMARENMEEWGTSAPVEHETVRAVVEAYAAGQIGLAAPPAKTSSNLIRYAPSFRLGDGTRAPGHHPYTTQTIAEFLGWMRPSGRPQDKLQSALAALELIEDGVLSEADFDGMTTQQAQAVVSQAQQARRQREVEAKAQQRRADDERKRAEAAEKERQRYEAEQRRREEQAARARNDAERRRREDQAEEAHRQAREAAEQRRAAERRRKEAEEKAKKEREKARKEATKVGRGVGSDLRSGKTGYREAGAAANRYRTKNGKTPPEIDKFIDRLAVQIVKIMEPNGSMAIALEEVIKYQASARDDKLDALVDALHTVRGRIEDYETRLGATVTDAVAIVGELEGGR